jgi:hypothetical protein
MTERERKAVEAQRLALVWFKIAGERGTEGRELFKKLNAALAALAAYDAKYHPMVPWGEFVNGKEEVLSFDSVDRYVICPGTALVYKSSYNAIRNALKGGA